MQRIRIALEYELEIPDDWQVLGTEKPEHGSLLIGGERYEPSLMWMKLTGAQANSYESEQVDDETHAKLADAIKLCSESIECL